LLSASTTSANCFASALKSVSATNGIEPLHHFGARAMGILDSSFAVRSFTCIRVHLIRLSTANRIRFPAMTPHTQSVVGRGDDEVLSSMHLS
jgi:hypothetical protein